MIALRVVLLGCCFAIAAVAQAELTDLVATGRLEAPAGAAIRYGELERPIFALADQDRLDASRLLRAALVASGAGDVARLYRYESKFAVWARQLEPLVKANRLAPADANDSERARGQAVFEFMHREILRGEYDINCSDLTETLDTGRYNCVSSTILFHCLAHRVGIVADGVAYPGHVRSVIATETGPLDVETTCATWFDIMDDPKERNNALAAMVGGVPSAANLVRRMVGPAELVGLVYYNRGVDLIERKQYAQAVAVNVKALRLDPENITAEGNLLAAINNWALDRAEQKDFRGALELLEQGRRLEPAHETFTTNYVILHEQWVDALCRRGRFDEALALLERARVKQPGQRYFDIGRFDVYRRWGIFLTRAGRRSEVQRLFASLRQRHGGRQEWLDAEAAVFSAGGARRLPLLHRGQPTTFNAPAAP